MRPLLTEAGFQTSVQDEAYFYKYEKGELVGQVAVHVDDFIIAGSTKFVADVHAPERPAKKFLKIGGIFRTEFFIKKMAFKECFNQN